MVETFRRPKPTEAPATDIDKVSLLDFLPVLDALREEIFSTDALEREQAQPSTEHLSAVRNDQSNAPLASLTTRANFDSRSSASPTNLEQPSSDTAPVLYVYNRLVTEDDVRRCMEDSGDLAAYESGRIRKSEAYRHTAAWIRNSMELHQ
jgi:hypothetical protein